MHHTDVSVQDIHEELGQDQNDRIDLVNEPVVDSQQQLAADQELNSMMQELMEEVDQKWFVQKFCQRQMDRVAELLKTNKGHPEIWKTKAANIFNAILMLDDPYVTEYHHGLARTMLAFVGPNRLRHHAEAGHFLEEAKDKIPESTYAFFRAEIDRLAGREKYRQGLKTRIKDKAESVSEGSQEAESEEHDDGSDHDQDDEDMGASSANADQSQLGSDEERSGVDEDGEIAGSEGHDSENGDENHGSSGIADNEGSDTMQGDTEHELEMTDAPGSGWDQDEEGD